MTPQSQPRKKKNSSRVNLVISAVFHAVLVGVLFYLAAREGLIGKKLQKIAVEMVREKKPEPPKPKPEPPKPEPPKIETPKLVETPRPAVAAPQVVAPPVVAPPAAELPAFDFAGGKAVNSESDPVQLYKGYMEYQLRRNWDKPDNLDDSNYVVEVQVNVDRQGRISDSGWLKGSGNAQWDDSVREVFKEVRSIDRPPPTNFPPVVTIRFDVQEETEPLLE
jgi:TonB family protein